MKHIAFLVSGGDAPGIRACLFTIVSAAPRYGMELLAVPHGLDGLIDGCFEESFYLGPETVSYGGSPIPSGRSKRFLDKEQQKQAAGQIEAQGVEGVVILGGGGSVQAADALSRQGVPCICVPVTIDNDVWGTDYTLGFDSGVHHILGIAAAIRETSLALSGRVFLVETLGANTGHIALAAGLAAAADLILLPEAHPTPSEAAMRVQGLLNHDEEALVIVAGEGALGNWQSGDQGAAFTYADEIRRVTGVASRVAIVGHAMRGARPTAFDALLGQRMGKHASELLHGGEANRMVVFRNNRVDSIDLSEAAGRSRPLDLEQVELATMRGCLVP